MKSGKVNLTNQANELSKYFDLIWVPNAGNCRSGNSMGYLPVYWFQNYNSSFGSKTELLNMIQTFKAKNVGVIEDVVLNHKAPIGRNGSWIDFVDEAFKLDGEDFSITWSGADICQNDDGGDVKNHGWPVTGANDTGEDFPGARDLDHTSENVQKNCKLYCKFLLNELGFAGFRYDMVKGYGAEFVKMYNDASGPQFSVGEYWDGNAETLRWWIDGTGKTSAAFDFSLKFTLNYVFGGDNWGDFSNKGLAGWGEYSRYSVTFVDNHDTFRDENGDRLRNNALAANACILALPGTPCIFLKHWQLYPEYIGNMILARKACGITNQSSITQQGAAGEGYAIKTQGSVGSVLCLLGNASYDTNGWKLIANGKNFAYYVSSNVTVNGLRPTEEQAVEKDIKIYVQASSAPHLYAWDAKGELNGSWPGTLMKETVNVNGTTFYTKTFKSSSLNIIFNDGGDPAAQTDNIEGLTNNSYFTYDGATTAQNVTNQYEEQPTIPIPSCAIPQAGHLYVYFKVGGGIKIPSVWAWNDSKNFCVQDSYWPGDEMKYVGDDTDGKKVFLWDGGTYDENSVPSKIIFSNGGDPQTATFDFENGGFYTIAGLQGNVTNPTGIESLTPTSSQAEEAWYTLDGRRVTTPTKGVYIQNGRKVIVR